jgi:hypothetical protein
MSNYPPFSVVLDANVWVAERLLQSSLGSALLYAVVRTKANFGLPEVVEREVNRVLPEMAEQAARNIKRDVSVLRQLSGHEMVVTGPSLLAVQQGIARRWKQLSGSIERIPFTFDQANSALSRIIEKTPPCGENNEQFRDCCIWDATLMLSASRPVHLLTADNAFYEARKPGNGLTRPLRNEIERKKLEVLIHPTIRDFLAALGDTVISIDEASIAEAIVEAVVPTARGIATERGRFELGEPIGRKIKGYATPKPAVIAVSFEVTFGLQRGDAGEDVKKAQLTIRGECDFDPTLNSVSQIEVKGWSQDLDTPWGVMGSHRADDLRQYRPDHMRILS